MDGLVYLKKSEKETKVSLRRTSLFKRNTFAGTEVSAPLVRRIPMELANASLHSLDKIPYRKFAIGLLALSRETC